MNQAEPPPPSDTAPAPHEDARLPSGTGAALSPAAAAHAAGTLRAMADPTRLRMLSMLLNAPSGEACVQDLAAPLDTSQPTVSHHLKILAEAGLVARDKRGKRSWYSIREENAALVRSLLG